MNTQHITPKERRDIAAQILAGLVTNYFQNRTTGWNIWDIKDYAEEAVKLTDALLEELSKEDADEPKEPELKRMPNTWRFWDNGTPPNHWTYIAIGEDLFNYEITPSEITRDWFVLNLVKRSTKETTYIETDKSIDFLKEIAKEHYNKTFAS